MLTGGEILKEYTNCLMDPIHAIETYLETFDKTQEGFVPFNLFYKQKEIIKAYKDNRFNIITKPRQAGVSTTTAAYLAIQVAFADKDNPEQILILANKQDMAQEFLSKVKDFLLQLPRWVWGSEYYGSKQNEGKTIFLTESKKELMLPNKSRVKAVATSKDALRGYTPTYLVMDEAAFIDNGVEVFGAALTALGTGGRATLISTPNGQDPLYYETYEQAKQGENNFNVVEMKWYEDPRYNKDLRWYKDIDKEGAEKGEKDEIMEPEVEFTKESYEQRILDGWKPRSYWYEEMCKGMNNNARMIAQELDVSFLGSGGNVIADEHIEHQEKFNVRDPKWISGEDDEYWIWEKPVEGHRYIMGVDVARGDGADSSTIVIIDMDTMEQVMEYKGKVQPDLLAEIVMEYGDLYDAHAVVDITGGMGVTTVLKLVEYNFKNLHYDDRKKLISRNKDLESYTKSGDLVPGFNANGVRLPMIAHLEYMIRTDQIKVRSRRLTGEMRTFIYKKNGRPDHQEGKHDDLLMALAMALFSLEHSFKKLQKLESKTKAMLDAWVLNDNSGDSKKDKDYNGNKFVSRNNRGKKGAANPRFPDVVKKNMQDPNGDYMWLFSGMK
jgi:hypothetical protein